MYDILIISIATTYGLNCYKEDYDQVWNKQQEWNITKTKMLCVPSINEQEIGKMGQWCFPIKKSPALASPPSVRKSSDVSLGRWHQVTMAQLR